MTRWIELDGAVNVRDMGGLATTDGGTIRTGRLLRADNLQQLTSGDVVRHRIVQDIVSAYEAAAERKAAGTAPKASASADAETSG